MVSFCSFLVFGFLSYFLRALFARALLFFLSPLLFVVLFAWFFLVLVW